MTLASEGQPPALLPQPGREALACLCAELRGTGRDESQLSRLCTKHLQLHMDCFGHPAVTGVHLTEPVSTPKVRILL